MEYEPTSKPITRMAVYEEINKNCEEAMELWEEFENHFFGWRWRDPIEYRDANRLFKWLHDHSKALQWAVEHGFLQEKKEEVFYKIGDRFERMGSEDKFILAACGSNNVTLINLGKGTFVNTGQIDDIAKIPQKRFTKLFEMFDKYEKLND